ncbi:hypothetical protein WISP_01200 [Willisornis vidua]|uniref:Vertebrate heat shock transcription factor C-terminal domain-containing protein n=1 Tax=Willisornis vidua TaxID=1566151 RepID=A0ABQ9E0H9_9PASS|nr:hypothetical protein WISP_01200 [Willisornis vidua]
MHSPCISRDIPGAFPVHSRCIPVSRRSSPVVRIKEEPLSPERSPKVEEPSPGNAAGSGNAAGCGDAPGPGNAAGTRSSAGPGNAPGTGNSPGPGNAPGSGNAAGAETPLSPSTLIDSILGGSDGGTAPVPPPAHERCLSVACLDK